MHILRTLGTFAVTLVAVASVPASDHFPEINGGCYPLWTRFNDDCYRFFGGPMTWEDAENYCQRYAVNDQVAHITSIHSKAENDFINELWQSVIVDPGLDEDIYEPDANRANGLWIGLEDREVEKEWHWSDNSTTHGFSSWRWYQPNNDDWDGTGVGEDCAHMYSRTFPWFWWYGDWNDIPCDRLLPFVCKLPIDQ